MTSQLPCFWCLFFSCQQQKKTNENGAAVTSLRSFLFRDDFSLNETQIVLDRESMPKRRRQKLTSDMTLSMWLHISNNTH